MKTITVSSDALKTKFYESFNTETQPSVGEKCNALRFGKQKGDILTRMTGQMYEGSRVWSLSAPPSHSCFT